MRPFWTHSSAPNSFPDAVEGKLRRLPVQSCVAGSLNRRRASHEVHGQGVFDKTGHIAGCGGPPAGCCTNQTEKYLLSEVIREVRPARSVRESHPRRLPARICMPTRSRAFRSSSANTANIRRATISRISTGAFTPKPKSITSRSSKPNERYRLPGHGPRCASMAYIYRQELTKFEYGICLAAALGDPMIHQQDPVGPGDLRTRESEPACSREQTETARPHPRDCSPT